MSITRGTDNVFADLGYPDAAGSQPLSGSDEHVNGLNHLTPWEE